MASITKRGNKWRARASYVDAKGERQQPSKTFDTKREAIEWATKLETQIIDGADINAGKLTFPAYFKNWIETTKQGTVRASTYTRYTTAANLIDKVFAGMIMEKLTTLSLQKELNTFGETHSKKYARDILTLIKTSLRDAYLDGIIKRDIFTRLQPAGQVVDKGDNFLNASDFTKLQDFLYSKTDDMQTRQFYIMALVALETGARLGEVQALTKADITDNHLTINKAYSSSTRKVTEPKTKSSVRTIAISKRLSAVLSDFFKTTGQDNLIENKMSTSRVSLEMQDLVREADIQPIHFHGLRHSHVSYLLHNGVDIDYVSKRVGHANMSVTLQIYAHMLKEKELAQDELTLQVLDNE